MKEKILCVDDDANILAALRRSLERVYAVDTAESGADALTKLRTSGPYAVILSDMQMPIMSGLELLHHASQAAPDTIRMVLTGFPDLRTAVSAVNRGHIFQFMPKPSSPETLMKALEAGVRQYRLVRSERDLLERTLNGAIRVLVEMLAIIDPVSFSHSQTLREEMRRFVDARKTGDGWIFEVAAMLSPIGNVTVPPQVLQKAWKGGTLTSEEQSMLDRASEVGAQLLVNIPRLETISEIVRYQNKNFDGSGAPPGPAAGDYIPKASRVLKVLIDRLKLREMGRTPEQAVEEMSKRTGYYDPEILSAVAGTSLSGAAMLTPFGAPRAVALRDLLPGMVLAEDVRTKHEMLIVKARTKITPILLQRLQNFSQMVGLQEPILIE